MNKPNFKCFDNDASLLTAKEILDGHTYKAFEDIGAVGVVVDIGANIGASTVYFRHSYPDATLYCFEPNPASYSLLEQNVSCLENVVIFNYGLYDIDAVTRLYRGTVDSVSDSIFINHNVSSAYVDIQLKKASEVLGNLALPCIDVLKIDTEGCEVNILRNVAKWLPGVKVLYLEYHSELDRILIDIILRKTHLLYSSRSTNPHRGELTYINNSLENRCSFDLIEN